MVNRIKYTPVFDIADYFTNVSKISGPIECTSLVTRIAINLRYSNLAYIEGDVPVLDLEHFVHAHILHEKPDYSASMLYGCKTTRLPNLTLPLYSCESLTLQFNQMGEACYSFIGPPRTHGRAHMEAAQQTMTTPQTHPQEPQWDIGMGVATQITLRVVVTTPLTIISSLASEPEPPPLPGTLTGTLLWSGTPVMWLTRLSMQ
jgi:hypothetical protein